MTQQIKHDKEYFTSIALKLRAGATNIVGGATWQMGVEEACGYLDALGGFFAAADGCGAGWMPRPTPLQIYGGEPFDAIEDLRTVLQTARRNAMVGEIWTVGAWAIDDEVVRERFDRIAGYVHALVVCVPPGPADESALERITRLMRESRQRDISVCLRCSTAPGAPVPREIFALDSVNERISFIIIGADYDAYDVAVRQGVKPEQLLSAPPRHRRCAELFQLVVLPGGDVYPCDAGAGLDALRLGSLHTASVDEIMARLRGDTDMSRLRDRGVYAVYRLLVDAGAPENVCAPYVDACHFHRKLLSDPALVRPFAAGAREPA